MAQKPSTPKGTRDFNPEQVAKRNYIFNTIRGAFDKFGFQPIETPSFENSDTLMGKYGDEGDRLIFKILDSGDFYEKKISKEIESTISIYLVITNIFRDLVKAILFDIRKRNVEFLTEDEFDSFFKNVDIVNSYPHIVNDRSSFLILDDKTRSALNKILNDNTEKIIEKALHFIKLKGLDLKPRIDDLRLIDLQFNWADRELLKDLTSNLIFPKLKLEIPNIEEINSNYLKNEISEKALRYDLTVPFARYVVQHQNEIEFPFKRYQIQPVWRADRPQKGRFREFYQCDADVVGSKSLWQEVEFIQLYDTVFLALKLEGVTIKINNRKILSGIAEVIGASDKLIDFTVALDKLDKIGEEKVKEEMLSKGISNEGISKLQPLFSLSGSFESQIESLKDILSSSEEGQKGIEELAFIDKAINELGLSSAKLQLDVTLARGLNYYTGAIFEVSAPEHVKMGSIGGGGRYDDLTGIFGMKNMSGVGISFGLDRIYLVIEELGLFPETVNKNIDVLFINFGDKEALFSLKAIKELRSQGVNAELYPDNAKMKKQMNHANNRNIPFVVIVGNDEMTSNTYALKNMITGEQEKVPLETLVLKTKKS